MAGKSAKRRTYGPDLHQFIWPVGAHEWAESADADPWLVRVVVAPRLPYQPLGEETGLFKNFADLPTKGSIQQFQDAILEFADTYGMLTSGERVLLPGERLGLWLPGERLGLWRAAIKEMNVALWLRDMLKNEDGARLEAVIRWRGSVAYYQGKPIAATTDADGQKYTPHLPTGVRCGDVMKPAWFVLQSMVNRKLDGNLSACLLWDQKERNQAHPNLYQRPKNLISAMWLQLANDIDGDRKYNRCEGCRRWFEVGSPPRTPRADARHCGGTCRQRARRASEKTEAGGMGSSE
jgi:hypothetical protein